VAVSLSFSAGVLADADEGGKALGDPYTLPVDPLGDSLLEVDAPVVRVFHGRELRFASEANADAFEANPEKYLAEVDRRIIEQQKPWYPLSECVVSGEAFGGDMGEPIDVVYGNRLIRFCCKGCIKDFKQDPETYLNKLDAAVIESQKDSYPITTCVVSGEALGGDMGEPYDYVVGNRLVRFCCKMCDTQFNQNPAKFLARLDASLSQSGESRDANEDGTQHDEHANHDEDHNHHHGHGGHESHH